MAFSEFELKRIEKLAQNFVEVNRPPAHIRAELDLGFRITGQSLELFDIRPNWRHPNEINELPFAKNNLCEKKQLMENILDAPRLKVASLCSRS